MAALCYSGPLPSWQGAGAIVSKFWAEAKNSRTILFLLEIFHPFVAETPLFDKFSAKIEIWGTRILL